MPATPNVSGRARVHGGAEAGAASPLAATFASGIKYVAVDHAALAAAAEFSRVGATANVARAAASPARSPQRSPSASPGGGASSPGSPQPFGAADASPRARERVERVDGTRPGRMLKEVEGLRFSARAAASPPPPQQPPRPVEATLGPVR